MHSAERAVAGIVRKSAQSPEELRARVAHFLWTGEGDFPDVLRHDPHTLGWLHQYLGEVRRQDAFRAHTRREAKHATAIDTTQLYTPRWVADWLVARSVDAADLPDTVLDPACGGGQMLLATVDALLGAGRSPHEAFGALRGVDLDEEAVWACRESLKLAAARALGARDPAVEASIDQQVVVGDGLRLALEPAALVITNPPYMGARSMTPAMRAELASFAPFQHDLYLAFISRCASLSTGSVAILAQQTLWYLARFEEARRSLLERGLLTDFALLGHGVFDALSGEKASVAAFVWRKGAPDRAPTRFWDLRDASDKPAALQQPPVHSDTQSLFALPGAPLAFWLPQRLRDAFGGPRLGDFFEVPGSQNKTGDNARFVCAISEAPEDWVPYSKGGKFAPWWGNWDWAVDWSEEARAFYAANRTSNLLDRRYWFREGLCYSDFGGKHFNARWMPPGCVFDMAGPAIFADGDDRDLLAALLVVLNSTAAREILNALNPTLHYQVRDVRNLPLPGWTDPAITRLAGFGHELVAATKAALDGTGEAPMDLELEADRAVAALYGTPELVVSGALRRRHHRLQGPRR